MLRKLLLLPLLLLLSFAAKAASVSFEASFTTTTQGGTCTSTNHDIGTADADRTVVVGIASIQDASTTGAAVTIGGNAATENVELFGTDAGDGSQHFAGIYSLDVAAGTTATIVVTWTAGESFSCAFFVYAAYGVDAAADTGSDTSNTTGAITQTLSADTTSGAVVVAVAGAHVTGTPGTSWTGVTEADEEAPFGDSTASSGSAVAGGAETPRTITAGMTTTGGSNSWAGASVVFPATAGGGDPTLLLRRRRD